MILKSHRYGIRRVEQTPVGVQYDVQPGDAVYFAGDEGSYGLAISVIKEQINKDYLPYKLITVLWLREPGV